MRKIVALSLAFLVTSASGIGSVQPAFAADDVEMFSSNNILFYSSEEENTNGGACSAGPNGLVGENNEEKIWNYWISRGLSNEQAAGITGNLQSESANSYSPLVSEFGKEFGEDGSGFGIAQWTWDPGRRGDLLKYLEKEHPSLMKKYYREEYAGPTQEGDGYIPRNSKTNELMPEEDNDALLLAELNFAYDESNSRVIDPSASSKGYGKNGDSEWKTIKAQKTIKDASNVWLYSFERPDNAEGVSPARAENGKQIYDRYVKENKSGSSSCDKASLARQIIENDNITLDSNSEELFKLIASGKRDGNTFPYGIHILALKSLAKLGEDHTISISQSNRAWYEAGVRPMSTHENGNGAAIDFASIDGQAMYTVNGAQKIIDIIKEYIPPTSWVGQLNHGALNLPEGVMQGDDSGGHLHVTFAIKADPDLECRLPIDFNMCPADRAVK